MLQEYTPYEWLMIDIANHMGLDKELYEPRMDWVDENYDNLESFTDKADKPELYLAAVLALRAVERGEETGHLVGLDAAASGLQIMAALTGCHVTARNTGLIGKKRGDIYSLTTKVMSRLLGSEVKVERDAVKKAQMPMYYGSKARPKEVYGEGTEEYNAFYEANAEVAPGAFNLLHDLIGSWVPYTLAHSWNMCDGYHCYCPVMVPKDSRIKIQELGHEISIKYRHEINCGTEKGLSNAANIVHSVDALVVREMGRRCNHNVLQLGVVRRHICEAIHERPKQSVATERIDILFQESGFMSLVGVEYINSVEDALKFTDSYLMALLKIINRTLDRESFEILFIHDEFKAHANHIQTLRQTYVEVMAEIADSNMLQHILTQVCGEPVTVDKLSDDLAPLILEGEYSIC